MSNVLHRINRSNIFRSGVGEGNPMAEASALGLRAGEWPQSMLIVDTDPMIVLHRGNAVQENGQFVGFKYSSHTGSFDMLVVND